MLLPSEHLIGTPVMSLQTGLELARTSGVIIDPRNLSIAAFRLKGAHLTDSDAVLHPSDIREFGEMGFIVNDSDSLMSPDGLVRLEEVIGIHFRLIDKPVVDERGRKLGRVADYTVDPNSYRIEQLFTKASLFRSLNTVGSIIRRSQIVNVTDDEIIVSAPIEKVREAEKPVESLSEAFVNPFRKPQVESPEA